MPTPTDVSVESGPVQQAAVSPAADEDSMGAIPRRSMRVKVLYTFDDQNKSNCLTRLPNALSVPVVSLDENTQVGVIELKTCIQAIVAASPELVGKLGHDYTVYAYDFSEYETPLVGQGMLSWILASASSTPNAPANESQTMVTGRVCKNMLGIFGQGMKETLEVKLKLVPVPTSMQQEYVENMERYHSLSQIMPTENFDYNAWSDFLKENPMLGQLAQPIHQPSSHMSQRPSIGGVEAFHDMLTRNSPSQEPMRADSFYDPSAVSFNAQSTRASSPAMSTLSFHHYQHNPESRPASRASVRSVATLPPQSQQSYSLEDSFVFEQQEEGPPRKRARITQAKRPKNTPLTAHNDSLRVTASTAASVRLHRPAAGMQVAALAAESIPRAPTPRPGDVAFGQRGSRRPPAPSTLRHASIDSGRPYMSPYEANMFSDNAVETDDDRGISPGDTPMDLPSSPPVPPQRTASPDPSSPTLPTLSLPNDSGFVSDMPIGHDEDSMDLGSNIWDGSDLPVPLETRTRRPPDRSGHPWQHVNPGPVDRLPQSYVPRPKQHYRKSDVQPIAESVEQNLGNALSNPAHMTTNDDLNSFPFPQQGATDYQVFNQATTMQRPRDRVFTRSEPTDSCPFGPTHRQQSQDASRGLESKATSPDAVMSHISPVSEADIAVYSRSATPNLPAQKPKSSKAKGLSRSQTWSGAEPMSDAPGPSDPNLPRSGSGARRKKYIKDKMEQAIANGELPPHCQNCGEIDTPTWRKAYTRVEYGSPDGLELSTDTSGSGVIAFEVIEPTEDNPGELSYRVFKNNITREEKESVQFKSLNLCNPCGLWLIKKCAMRPRKLWDKSDRGTKRKRQATAARAKSMTQEDDMASDAIVPHSEPVLPEEKAVAVASVDGVMPPPLVQSRHATVEVSGMDKESAEEALRRAIQSSPAGLRGSRHSPIDVDPDLTPKPTRRLLFPSPRKDGETKSLANTTAARPAVVEDTQRPDIPQEKPRCQRCKRLRKGCDRERPCGRCDNAGIGHDGCIPCEMPRTNWFETPTIAMATVVEEDNADKENCPPPPSLREEDDEFADLFEDRVSPRTTPTKKDNLLQELLRTPTPGSRQRNPLTPRRGAENTDVLATPCRVTPSRNILTPRATRAATNAPETPFTRSLNQFLSEGNFPSPSQAIDFGNFPTFNTPGRSTAQFGDFMADDFLSSDMPMPSSPPKSSSLGLGFDLYEDPNTSTMGLWSGGSMFGSDALVDIESASKRTSVDISDTAESATLLKMNVGGITVDFAAMIEEVVGDNEAGDEQVVPKLVEEQSTAAGTTPDVPVAE